MAVLHTEPPMTRAQFFELDRDGDSVYRHTELIGGELVYLHGRFENGRFVNSPSYAHQRVARDLLVALVNWCAAGSGRGEVIHELDTPLPGGEDVVKPDLLWWPRDRRSSQGPVGPPALVIEVLSPSSRRYDLGVKRDLYAQVGVDEVWLVDPLELSAVVDRRLQGSFELDDLDDELTSPLLPGFRLPLRDLAFRD